MAAAIGRVQLERLPDWVCARRENAEQLSAALGDIPGVETPVEPDGRRHAYHQYTIRTPRREALADRLDAAGVDTAVYYPTPIHRLGAYEHVDQRFPVAERAAQEVLSLPVHPGLSDEDVETIAAAVGRAAELRQ